MKQGLDSAVSLIKTRPRLFALFPAAAPHAWIIKDSVTCLGQAAVFCLFFCCFARQQQWWGKCRCLLLTCGKDSEPPNHRCSDLIGWRGRLKRENSMDRIMTQDVDDYTLYPLCPSIITVDMSGNHASCHSKLAPPPPSLSFSPPILRLPLNCLFLSTGCKKEADTNRREWPRFDHDNLYVIMIFFMNDHLCCRFLFRFFTISYKRDAKIRCFLPVVRSLLWTKPRSECGLITSTTRTKIQTSRRSKR